MRMPAERIFARDYSDARAKFLGAAAVAKGEHREYTHDVAGPSGERLSTDVVWFGAPDAPNVLVLKGGTHGVELYCGSACMIDILIHGQLPRDWALCCIHAVNPWGAAWGRRENEDNVDLNRNYVDFDAGPPRNDLYREIHSALLLRDLSDASVIASNDAIASATEVHGARAVLTARSAGQYEHSDGLHYGGTRPTASRRTVEEVIRQYSLASRANVVVWDYHTGAGPFGYCEPIYLSEPVGKRFDLARGIFGPWLTTQRTNNAVTPPQTGLGSELWERRCGPTSYLIALEFGTYPMTPSGGILRQDNFLHRQPGKLDWSSQQVRRVKSALREEYDPQSPIWREMVLAQNRMILGLFCEAVARSAN